jgi:hypothetical protein
MKYAPRKALRYLLGSVSRHPRLKRALVDLAYRLPWFDTRLRNLVYRVEHPEAMLDVDPAHLPEGSRRSLARIRARMPR